MDNDKRLKLAKEALESGSYDKETIEYIFPELKESEDEKTRRCISDVVRKYGVEFATGTITKEKMLAWLDKQGGQKETPCNKCRREQPSHSCQDILELGRCALEHQCEQKTNDKIEPKFHEGEWVVQGRNILKILCVGNEYYCFETVGGYRDDMLISEIDSLYHLWTIQDAKDGDVLVDSSDKGPFIFKGFDRFYPGLPVAHCGTDDKGTFKTSGYGWRTDEGVEPATKEQRTLLFQKMADAGYEWDATKKELRKK